MGRFTVRLPGLANPFPDNVQVSSFGARASCGPTTWSNTASGGVDVHVDCRDQTGGLADVAFNLVYVNQVGLRGDSTGKAAFFLADNASAASYVPATAYNWVSTGSQHASVKRLGKGLYEAKLNGISAGGGSVQVSPFGGGTARCQVGSIPVNTNPQTVQIRCFDVQGRPRDAKYTFLFTR
jgi:hypothetical protein